MSYRNELKKRIEELNQEISEDKGQIEALKKELKRQLSFYNYLVQAFYLNV